MSRPADKAPPFERHYSDEELAGIVGVHPDTPAEWRRLSTPKKRRGPRWVRIDTGAKRKMVRYPESAIREWLAGDNA